MEKLEQKNAKKVKRANLQKIILESIATAGILSIAMFAPNVIGAMGKLGLIPHRRQKEYVSSSASKMVKKGLLKYNGKYYELTSLGQKILRRWELGDFKIRVPKKWDKKWRVIIFDIPEKKKSVREYIRTLFSRAGLRRLQDSVWVYPYDCEDIVALLKTDLGVGKDVLYLIVDEIERDKYLREEFNLT